MMEFTHAELEATLEILEELKPEYIKRKQRKRIELIIMKYKYWKLLSEIRGNSVVFVGGN